jgi:hypothetical protein
VDDYSDLGDVLLGGGLHAVSDSFDPFEVRPRHQGRPTDHDDDHDDGDIDSDFIDHQPDDQFRPQYSGREGFGEHDGGGIQSIGGYQPDDDQPLPWAGGTKGSVVGSAERREREAAGTGDRNVRRTAERHGGGTDTGAVGHTAPDSTRVDSSISAAQQRIRNDLRGSSQSNTGRLDVGRSIAVQRFQERGLRGTSYELPRQAPHVPTRFESTSFFALLTGLKANAQGDWILTFKVDRDERHSIYALDDAFNIVLDIGIKLRRFTQRDESA